MWTRLAFASLLCLSSLAVADPRAEAQARKWARAENAVWQALFGQHALRQAEKQLGKPYIWGDKEGSKGFDCSGLTAYVYGTLGVAMAPSALGQYAQGSPVDKGGLLTGDLVFFSGNGSPLHVGIYGGEGRFIHAPGAGKLIQWAGLNDPYFRARFLGGRRLAPDLQEAKRAKQIPPTKE